MTGYDSLECPAFEDVREASVRLSGIAHVTPVMTSRQADAQTGARLFFKMENLQRGGAFKFRGAYNAVASLSADARRTGVVAFSSGNHALSVALACRLLGVKATIIMPNDAPQAKMAAARDYGAEVILYDRASGDRDAMAAELARERGLAVVPPFDHPHVIAGQGTVTLELIEAVGPLDYLFVPVGGGGLIAGSALAAAALSPDCQVVGVEPEAGDDGRRSLESGAIVTIDTPDTIADGARTRSLGDYPFAIMRRHVRRMTTVNDAALERQMSFFLQRMKLLVEPTGCLGAAAAFVEAERGARIGVIVSGGNVDLPALGRLAA
jgi:threonine dehydratase